ncbi:signal transducer and activator of transcription A-like [Gossypium australe]|uniref:Signal transducer and activator of transcription A-like n=1 Tax=Gossypium australe TaxID=47621 RepID=A0A5B6WU47_9ROSI|nr:signal transducer and activator of transcription A-like [Gossypium australe]
MEGEMQSMRIDVKQVQFEYTNLVKTLTKLEDQMRQLMSMMGDIKRQIGTSIPIDDEPELEEVAKLTTKPEKEQTKEPTIAKVPFPSRTPTTLKKLFQGVGKFKLDNASCGVLISRKVPPKLKDPGSFPIPTEIGDIHFSKALYDLRAIINVMRLFIYEKIRLEDLKNIQITLSLVDRSSVQPKGVLKDMLIKVRNFIIPADFVILDFKEGLKYLFCSVGLF